MADEITAAPDSETRGSLRVSLRIIHDTTQIIPNVTHITRRTSHPPNHANGIITSRGKKGRLSLCCINHPSNPILPWHINTS